MFVPSNVELLNNTPSDLLVVNVARVSFNKWSDTYDNEKDTRLIKYLARHKHISPFFHTRFTFDIESIYFNRMTDPTLTMGAVWKPKDSHWRARHSIFGWIRWIKEDIIKNKDAYTILKAIHDIMPVSLSALMEVMDLTEYEKFIDNDPKPIIEDNDPEFIDYSFRITCPIPVARQLFTHRMFATNEVSRRYVDDPPSLYRINEFRERPDNGIKQGSKNSYVKHIKLFNMIKVPVVKLYEKTCGISVNIYNKMIDNNIAPEVARFVLPQSMMTTIIFTGSKASWDRMLELRLDSHAQKDVRLVATMINYELNKK